MTDAVVAQVVLSDSRTAGMALGEQVREELQGHQPDALILFASSSYDYEQILAALHETCQPKLLVGCSSAGEFKGSNFAERSACAIALRSDEMHFAAGIGHGLSGNRESVARELVAGFDQDPSDHYAYHSAMVLTDALAGHADALIEQLALLTAGRYRLFGGGAGDDAKFHSTHVFFGKQAVSDAAVGLEILSNKPIGIGARHGWEPATPPMRVTEADGARLVSVNMVPAVEMFQEHAEATGQHFDPQDPLPFFLHNVIGIQSGDNQSVRVPLQAHPDGSVSCAAEIPIGSTICIMATTSAAAADAATKSVEAALEQLGNYRPKVAIFFDCVATRLRTGREFGNELSSVQSRLGTASLGGCNSYGQIVRADAQYGGFHNCTAVIGIIPE